MSLRGCKNKRIKHGNGASGATVNFLSERNLLLGEKSEKSSFRFYPSCCSHPSYVLLGGEEEIN